MARQCSNEPRGFYSLSLGHLCTNISFGFLLPYFSRRRVASKAVLRSLSTVGTEGRSGSTSPPDERTLVLQKFAMTGVAGYVAPRHLRAIRDSGNRLFAAHDPHDSVGVLDQYFADVAFFQNYARFERHLSKKQSRVSGDGSNFDYLSVCSPNFLHDNHVRLALNLDAHAICEKPLVINPLEPRRSRDARRAQSRQRLHDPAAARSSVPRRAAGPTRRASTERSKVDLTYVTSRGPWYHYSWKGDEEKSGGLATNIGIHFFDLLIWLFGGVQTSEVQHRDGDKVAGLPRARARRRQLVPLDRPGRPALRARTRRPDDVSLDHLRRRRDRVQRRLHRPAHARSTKRRLPATASASPTLEPSIELAHQMATTETLSEGTGTAPLSREIASALVSSYFHAHPTGVQSTTAAPIGDDTQDLALLPRHARCHDRQRSALSARTSSSPTR